MPRTMFLSPTPTKNGVWYYGLRCQACAKAIALFKDRSHGTVRFPYDRTVLLGTACPHCKVSSPLYRASEVQPYQA